MYNETNKKDYLNLSIYKLNLRLKGYKLLADRYNKIIYINNVTDEYTIYKYETYLMNIEIIEDIL